MSLKYLRPWSSSYFAATLGGMALLACGPAADDLEAPELQSSEASPLGGLSANGLSANGFSSNGLSANGLSANGLSANGLSANGLSSGWNAKFKTWCNQHVTDGLCNNVMKYMTLCACDAGVTKSFTTSGGKVYTWAGGLGVADDGNSNTADFCGGAAPNAGEQRRITACLMGHVNSNAGEPNVTLTISQQLTGPTGATSILRSTDERNDYPSVEGTFFGNAWTGKMYSIELASSFAYGRSYDARFWHAIGRDCTMVVPGAVNPCGFENPREDDPSFAESTSCTRDLWGKPTACTVNGVTFPTAVNFLGYFTEPEQDAQRDVVLSNGATVVNDNDGNPYAVNIPYDTDSAPASVTYQDRWVGGGAAYRVQMIYRTNTASRNCKLEIDRTADGTWDQTFTRSFAASTTSGTPKLAAYWTFTSATSGTQPAMLRFRTNAASSDRCPLIDSILVSRQ